MKCPHCQKEISKVGDGFQAIAAAWNSVLGVRLGAVTGTYPGRTSQASKVFLDNPSIEYWTRVMTKASSSEFLMGGGPKGWRMTFDWVIKDGNHVRIMEGNYHRASRKTGLSEFKRS